MVRQNPLKANSNETCCVVRIILMSILSGVSETTSETHVLLIYRPKQRKEKTDRTKDNKDCTDKKGEQGKCLQLSLETQKSFCDVLKYECLYEQLMLEKICVIPLEQRKLSVLLGCRN